MLRIVLGLLICCWTLADFGLFWLVALVVARLGLRCYCVLDFGLLGLVVLFVCLACALFVFDLCICLNLLFCIFARWVINSKCYRFLFVFVITISLI